MALTPRKLLVFAAGLAVGGAVALAASWWLGLWHKPVQMAPAQVSLAPVTPLAAPLSAAAPAPQPIAAAAMPAACDFEPLLPASGRADGVYRLDTALASPGAADPRAFLAVAQEAAGAGRQRDAEVAWIAACRRAAQASAAPTAPRAEVQAQLAEHYARAAARERSPVAQSVLLARARELLADSVSAYSAVLGEQASRTRMARQQLAAIEQATASPGDEQVLRAAARMGAAPATTGEAQAASAVADARPACAPGSGCDDAELAQLEADLRRLQAQAGNVTDDPAGFRQRSAQADAARAQCRDSACLRQWVAQRRRQLINEF